MNWLKRHWHSLVVLFFLALGVKLGIFFHYSSFSQDEVRDYLYIQELIANKNFYIPLGPTVGPAMASDNDFALPPLYYYLQFVA